MSDLPVILIVFGFLGFWIFITYLIYDPLGRGELRQHRKYCADLRCTRCYPWLKK